MIERWLVAIRDHPSRPPGKQQFALERLALRLDWATGRGFASYIQVAADADVNERTVGRATKWARGAELLIQTRRGHYISPETAIASEWQLTMPGYPQAKSQPDTGVLLGKPTGQNGQPNRTTGQPNRTPMSAHQESVSHQESSSSGAADVFAAGIRERMGWARSARFQQQSGQRLSHGDQAYEQAQALKAQLRQGKTVARE